MQSDTEGPLVKSQFNLPTQQVYFTLHKDDHSPAFYTSEKITGSLNPTWQSFDLQRNDSTINLASQFVVVRVWVGVPQQFKVKIESHVHLTGLVFFSDKLQVSGLKHGPDTLLFGMYNHIFCYLDPAVPHPHLQQVVPDMHVPRSEHLHSVFMDQSILRPSYTESSLRRLKMVLKAVVQTQASVGRIHSTIEDKLVSSSERSEKLSKREAVLSRVRQLRQELLWQHQQKQKDGDELSEEEATNEAKGQLLKSKRVAVTEFIAATEEKRQLHIQSREMLVKENAQVMFRRRQLISELVHHIYPIRKNEKEDYYICNVLLPNAEEYQGHDENMIAVSLGFVCHLTLMVSQFLDMPLRYPMIHKGSRSLIMDHVHSKLVDKDREFPLFGKGKEKFQYNYGVFLLNKNISQLRFYCGMGTSDLRQTLSNLKSLLEQRLGFRVLSPSQKGMYPGSSTPVTASLENSLASQMSLAHSSSTSSHPPPYHQHHSHHQHHPHQHHLHHHHQLNSNSDSRNIQSPEKFDMSLEIPHRATSPDTTTQDMALVYKNLKQQGEASANPSMSSTLSSWIESTSKMTKDNHHLNGNVDDVDGKVRSEEVKTGGHHKGMEEEEEDEGEDLFQGSEDSFFSVKPVKAAEVLKDVHITDSSHMPSIDDLDQGQVATLSPTPHRSFMLIKPRQEQHQQSSSSTDNGGDDNYNHHTAQDYAGNHTLSPSPPTSSSLSSSPPHSASVNARALMGTNNSSIPGVSPSTVVLSSSSSKPMRMSSAVPIPPSSNGSHNVSAKKSSST